MGAAGQSLRAAGGNETLFAALSTGNNTLVGGSGKTTMYGGAGDDTFEFIKGAAGTDRIYTLPTGDFSIHLTGFQPGEAYAAWSQQANTGAGTTIRLSDGTRVTFENIGHLDLTKFT